MLCRQALHGSTGVTLYGCVARQVGAQGLELLFRNNPAVPKIIMFSRKDEVLPSMKVGSPAERVVYVVF